MHPTIGESTAQNQNRTYRTTRKVGEDFETYSKSCNNSSFESLFKETQIRLQTALSLQRYAVNYVAVFTRTVSYWPSPVCNDISIGSHLLKIN